MRYSARFHFFGSLKELASRRGEKGGILYRFHGSPSVKDAIEAMGIPHPEVDLILVNQVPVSFSYRLKNGDLVEVYPENNQWAQIHSLRSKPLWEGFIADVHLGKLAKSLRMLGFDTCYSSQYTEEMLLEIALSESRILLSRGTGLLKRSAVKWGYCLRSEQPDEQLSEVIRHFQLRHFRPFTRCLACNGNICEVNKEGVRHLLESDTRRCFNDFFRCDTCKRVYWKGSHFERMQRFIQQIES